MTVRNDQILELKKVLADYKLVDLSLLLEEGTPCYLPYHHMVWTDRKLGDGYNAYVLQIAEHHATHVDAPAHVGGSKWLDDVDLNIWHGPCRVIDLTSKKLKGKISSKDIKSWEKRHGKLCRDEIVLLRYKWDKKWTTKYKNPERKQVAKYFRDFPGLAVEASAYLGKCRVKLVGTDTPTVDSFSAFLDALNCGKTEPAHIKLLREKSIPILEGLKNLDKLPPNGAYLFAFPLNVKHGSGSPVRAVAFVPRHK
jgi:kynurenine formamidase